MQKHSPVSCAGGNAHRGSGCETVSLCALRRLTVAKQRDSANGYLASLLEARSKVMITLDIRANR